MNDDDDVRCAECGWCGSVEELADDGPGHEHVCPACGSDDVSGEE